MSDLAGLGVNVSSSATRPQINSSTEGRFSRFTFLPGVHTVLRRPAITSTLDLIGET
jgi:hypothetical protein